MVGAILKATNSSFQKNMTFCRSIYVKKVMKLLAFIFEQPSYIDKNVIPTKSVGQTLRGCSQELHVYVKIGQRQDDPL